MGEHAGDVGIVPARFRHVGAADAAALRPVRRAFCAWLESVHCAEAMVQDAVLAFSELFTNALEARAASVEFAAVMAASSLTLSCCDDGPRWQPPDAPPTMPEPAEPRGRGLALLAKLGTLDVVRVDGCTVVSLHLTAG